MPDPLVGMRVHYAGSDIGPDDFASTAAYRTHGKHAGLQDSGSGDNNIDVEAFIRAKKLITETMQDPKAAARLETIILKGCLNGKKTSIATGDYKVLPGSYNKYSKIGKENAIELLFFLCPDLDDTYLVLMTYDDLNDLLDYALALRRPCAIPSKVAGLLLVSGLVARMIVWPAAYPFAPHPTSAQSRPKVTTNICTPLKTKSATRIRQKDFDLKTAAAAQNFERSETHLRKHGSRNSGSAKVFFSRTRPWLGP